MACTHSEWLAVSPKVKMLFGITAHYRTPYRQEVRSKPVEQSAFLSAFINWALEKTEKGPTEGKVKENGVNHTIPSTTHSWSTA